MEKALSPTELQKFIPFDELSENTVTELMAHMQITTPGPSKVVFKRGVKDTECHFLIHGTLDLADDHFRVTTLTGDSEENLLALDASHPVHRCSAITKTPCTIASIQRDHLQLISTWVELACLSPSNGDDADIDWLETLLTSELFSHIPPSNIQRLLSRFEEHDVSLGDVIIQEGDDATECYVLKQGKALVTRTHNHQTTTLAALNTGALFGEDSLISQLSRSASVTMSSDGVVMSLTKDDFNTLMKSPVLEYVKEDTLDELMENSDVGVVVIDVRPLQEASTTPIRCSKQIPLSELRNRLPELHQDFLYVVAGEGRAEAAAYILSEAGLDVRVLSH